MTPYLHKLQSYPFEKLAALKQGITPPAGKRHIALSIGEPAHATPHLIQEALLTHLNGLSNYPTTKGLPELRQAIAVWLARRFGLAEGLLNPEAQILPVSGTREALFSFAQCLIDRTADPLVVMPNPFYQIYEGAALLAGAEPYFLNTIADNAYLPDFDAVPEHVWRRCQLLYLCTPGNPSGAVMPRETLIRSLELAEKYDFVIASDECYSELYDDENSPPPGLLEAAFAIGNTAFKRCVAFHSLSKRSNAPGLRSGFVAGDAAILRDYFKYRTYHGAAMPLPTQHASIAAWGDEKHVAENRRLYREKFAAVIGMLGDAVQLSKPPAGFYLWIETPIDDTEFTRQLFARENVTVLPGSYLSREFGGLNPGRNHVRIALVAPLEECVEAAFRIKDFLHTR
ncbi:MULTISPECIES: succinyldiaminopimelate transaminase [Methylomicrobium]|uniref:Succinyldiaminopimelate transaminase n=1 Tax=Methylomicrobium album BG8 TaxID=686340 RepID=H8GJY0_METAL|nr:MULTISPECIES: succinyldiaminopimelate transaminase [Methylomicrobium]EIC27939.1 succinyldiaminopimelate transaminase [Methylomicrobium album BG8]